MTTQNVYIENKNHEDKTSLKYALYHIKPYKEYPFTEQYFAQQSREEALAVLDEYIKKWGINNIFFYNTPDRGPDIDEISSLFEIACMWNIKLGQLLLDKGADINVIYRGPTNNALINGDEPFKTWDDDTEFYAGGGNIFVRAVQYFEWYFDRDNNPDFVHLQWLVDKGANINCQDRYGYTALHHSAGRLFIDTVKFLLKNGADTTIKNDEGKTVFNILEDVEKDDSYLEGVQDIALLLLKYGYKCSEEELEYEFVVKCQEIQNYLKMMS